MPRGHLQAQLGDSGDRPDLSSGVRRYSNRQLLSAFWPHLRPHSGRIGLAVLALTM